MSAFENKILERSDPGYQELADRLKANFSTFADHILRQSQQEGGCGIWSCRLDVHWMPYVSRCAYCALSYDLIGKVETFGADVAGVLRRANISSAAIAPDLRTNRRKANNLTGKEYFSRLLTTPQRRSLFEMYRLDFEMFGYSASEYL